MARALLRPGETALQTHIPQAALSRVSSYDYLLSAGLMRLGLVLAGPVSESLGVRPTVYAMTIVAVPTALALLCVPAVRRLPAHSSDTRSDTGGVRAAVEAGPS
ncbi:hypothetical protein P1P75_21075 [Streptomyces sp. ID05-39B]|uniref:hypothetical protein n=1 Tax=Streptomyces sp. ID05-39B TaxID=3028664 RepID=UPI0029B1BF59|nr:hypothetical protein [Streptomyces sp. ID05-39B]MDX3528860.1 hypothetical protein [Streptomyces sp. ID05-39B]